jgi:hypothetical protein
VWLIKPSAALKSRSSSLHLLQQPLLLQPPWPQRHSLQQRRNQLQNLPSRLMTAACVHG